MKQLIFTFSLFFLLFLSGCADTTVKNEQDQVQIEGQVQGSAQKQNQVEQSVQKEFSLAEIKQKVCSFVKNCAYTEKLTAGKAMEFPENQPFKYHETLGGPFVIIEGEIGDFSSFVQNQAKLRFDKLKKSIKPTDFSINASYSVQESDGAYIYKYKVWKYMTTSKVAKEEKLFMEPIYGARMFVYCPKNYVIEIFPDVFGGRVLEWSGLNEQDYDATIENGIQFQINNMKPKADGLISMCS